MKRSAAGELGFADNAAIVCDRVRVGLFVTRIADVRCAEVLATTPRASRLNPREDMVLRAGVGVADDGTGGIDAVGVAVAEAWGGQDGRRREAICAVVAG